MPVFFLTIILLGGLVLISQNPILVRFNRKENSCTREFKFLWEKNYHIEKLCSLNKIKSVEGLGFKNLPFLILKDNSYVSVYIAAVSATRLFNKELQKISDFLKNKKCQELILKEWGHILMGYAFTIIGIFGLYVCFFD